jgi:hypothetical protein
MATYTSVDPRQLAQAQAEAHQLTQPIHIAIRRRIITHPPLLDQLRAATQPGHTRKGPERRTPSRSQPPAAIDPLDALAELYVELAGWHARIGQPTIDPQHDWQKRAIQHLVAKLPAMAGEIATWAVADLHSWWTLAARHTGWRLDELRKLR